MILNQSLAFLVCWDIQGLCGELGSDDAKYPWFLLHMFLYLPFAFWLSVVLAGLAVCDCGTSLL